MPRAPRFAGLPGAARAPSADGSTLPGPRGVAARSRLRVRTPTVRAGTAEGGRAATGDRAKGGAVLLAGPSCRLTDDVREFLWCVAGEGLPLTRRSELHLA